MLAQRLGLRWPLIQAPMAGVQLHALTVAVSEAGALGSLPAAMLSPAALRDELQAIRAATERPWNLNFFCHTEPAPDESAEAAWREALRPYYDELGVDAAKIARRRLARALRRRGGGAGRGVPPAGRQLPFRPAAGAAARTRASAAAPSC